VQTFSSPSTISGLSHGIIHLMLVLAVTTGCKREETFPDLGDKVASPIDVAVSSTGSHFYALNADFDRRYNVGSILTMDADGNKTSAVEVPRLGRTIAVAGTDMLVAYDRPDEKTPPGLLLFSLADPAKPAQVASWELDCEPMNIAMREDLRDPNKTYTYFALTCVRGELYIGTLADNRAASTIKKVRNYGITRRAIHLDPVRGLVLLFSTDIGEQRWIDLELEDSMSYSDTTPDGTAVANEVPDEYEKNKRARANAGRRQIYQFAVYNINREAAATGEAFPFRETIDPVVQRELRWIYFNLFNFDGAPDTDSGYTADGLKIKYYRTNFFAARPDPDDPDAFFLSQRGHVEANKGGSRHANNVIRVSFTGDLAGPETGDLPKTGEVLRFERVYGFKGELNPNGLQFPGDFVVTPVNGQTMLIVNHFRDLVNWPRSQAYYSLAAKVVGEEFWHNEIISTDPFVSYFQVTVNSNGRGIACSFYGNAVILFDVQPGTAITEVKRIN